ncbi:MAG: DUF3488 and transglutaminase-like domain-containing protein [Planctomycetia bacterium]|nr:DUF3488 and transglutaminase-like domain-containing protein [Planctomycetia bacterium]
MPTEATFRFSTYLTLAFACVVIGYAEYELLPEVAVFAGLAVIGLGVLYFLESRVVLLSIPAANRLGGATGLVFLAWAGYRIKRELDTYELGNTGWHMLMVAMLGPLLMMSIVAKVARGEKHAGDYWFLHGAALTGVGLSAALAQDAVCFVLIGLYLLTAIWSLALFHLHRASGTVPRIPDKTGKPAPAAVAVTSEDYGRSMGFRTAFIWTVVAAVVVVPIYLLTPRSDAEKAEFGKPRIEIGYAADQMVDLNRTGSLNTNTEEAFEVTATYPDGRPKTDLSPNQRWRGATHLRYLNGKWLPEGQLPVIAPLASNEGVWAPPRLGPDQFILAFNVPTKVKSPVFADPIRWVPRQSPPIAVSAGGFLRGWMPVADGSFFDPLAPPHRRMFRYIQVYRVGEDPDLGSGFRLVPGQDEILSALRRNPVPRVTEYADRLIAQMIARGELPKEKEDWQDQRTLLPKQQYHDVIARAFSAHLATTPTLRYTTNLKREKTNVDAVEDFLFHVRSGHCERFASALVLLLRSQGIPAVYVLGFKGCEHQGDGRYIVKQEHAHAWVDALVSKPGLEGRLGGPEIRVYHWLSLDPTPGGADPTESDNSWWDTASSWVQTRFDSYVRDYTPAQRQKALSEFVEWLKRPATILGVGTGLALVLGVIVARRWRRRERTPEPEPAPESTRWFGELVALLASHGFVPAPGDTPREFAEATAVVLRQRPGCAQVAEVPLAWAEAYYQDRFGSVPPSDARLAELEAGLDSLRRALASGGAFS